MTVITPFFDVVAGVAILAGRSSLLDTGVFKTANTNFTIRHLLALGFIGVGVWNLWKIERAQDKLKKSLGAEEKVNERTFLISVREYDEPVWLVALRDDNDPDYRPMTDEEWNKATQSLPQNFTFRIPIYFSDYAPEWRVITDEVKEKIADETGWFPLHYSIHEKLGDGSIVEVEMWSAESFNADFALEYSHLYEHELWREGDMRIVADYDEDFWSYADAGWFEDDEEYEAFRERVREHGVYVLTLEKQVQGKWEWLDSVRGNVPNENLTLIDIAKEQFDFKEAESFGAEPMFVESDSLMVELMGFDGSYRTDGEVKMGYTTAAELGFEPKELKPVMWVWDDIEGYGAFMPTEKIRFI